MPNETQYLKNPATGVVFVSTAALRERGDLVPCNADGSDPQFETVHIPLPETAKPAAERVAAKKAAKKTAAKAPEQPPAEPPADPDPLADLQNLTV